MSLKSKKIVGEPEPPGYHPEQAPPIPWPEWLDSELNAEKWDNPKNGTDGRFLDTQQIVMPSSLEPFDWKRAPELKDLTGAPVIYETIAEYPDFLTNNKHLLHSEFVRWFISTMINLQYCGRTGLEIEGESPNFIWNGATQCWQGWFYVYSLNKAGKGAQHRPVVNPNGKYVVRLYFMGAWRRILIDDLVPVDKGGKALLPYTANNCELWPMLLAKALLKLAALSWTPQREIVDFSPLICLTGWMCLPLDTKSLSPLDKWNFLTTYAEHFEWPPQAAAAAATEEESVTATTSTKTTTKAKSGKRSKHAKLKAPPKPIPTMLFAKLNDTRELEGQAIPDIAPCWSHPVFIEQSRDIPLDPSQVKAPLAKWKLYRWLDWAIRHGLIDPVEYFVPIRCLKVVSPLRECSESVVYVYDDLDIEEPPEMEPEPLPKEKKERKEKKLKESPLPDISLWGDFNKMTLYMMEIQLFYKPSHFKYCARVSDTMTTTPPQEGTRSKPGTAKEGKKASARSTGPPGPPPFISSYKWQHKMTRSGNEPMYLLIDSVDSKFILLEFSAMQSYPVSPPIVEEKNAFVEQLLPPSKYSYLTMEDHNWFFRSTQEEPSAHVKTLGTSATVLEVEPGRHLFRMFFRSEYSYFITIASDTIFHLGNRLKMHHLMSVESDTVDLFVRRISNGVKKAFGSFGTSEYTVELKALYHSYLPNAEDLQKPAHKLGLRSVHDLFFKELVKTTRRSFRDSELPGIFYGLRVYFLDPHIGINAYESNMLSSADFTPTGVLFLGWEKQEMEGEVAEDIDYNRAAVKIQSFFRMVLINCYQRVHNPAHKKNRRVLESLQRVVELFDFGKRESVAHQMLRNMIRQDGGLKDLYPCHKDFQHVLQVEECRGSLLNVQPEQWVPVVRLTINALEAGRVLAAIDLFTHLPSYMLRIFNNDTGREMLRLVNSPVPMHFRYNRSGYTVFGYGWSDVHRFKELEWILHIVTRKGDPMLYQLGELEPVSLTTEIPSLVIDELSNNYIPNMSNLICRWFLEVSARSLVSFRLQASYDKVQTKLMVTDEEEKVLSEVSGGSTVILPNVCLEYEKPGSQGGDDSRFAASSTLRRGSSGGERPDSVTRYILEAYVLKDSWPLTESEWDLVKELKLKGTIYNPRTSRLISLVSSPASNKRHQSELARLSRGSRKSTDSSANLDQPYWILQVVTDVGAGVKVKQDRRREEEIAAMKASWEAANPGRLRRGLLLREAFLDENCIIISESITSVPKVAMTSEGLAVITGAGSQGSVASWVPLLTKEQIRTLKPPVNLMQMLPALDLTIYMVKDEEEEDRWVKTESDEEMLRTQRAINILDFEQSRISCLEEMAEMLDNQQQRYILLFQHYNEEVATWKALMDETSQGRVFAIEGNKKLAASQSRACKKKKKK